MKNKNNIAQIIKNKALEFGYDNCGIINIYEMNGYKEKLNERISRFPEIKIHSEDFYNFADLQKKYEWAKSIIVCINSYNCYKVPDNLEGIIGKYYLFDTRRNKESKEYKNSLLFEKFLVENGLRVETNRDFGITALRWAALKANIGIVRKNNFLYSNEGSWINIEAWLIDIDLEMIEKEEFKKCPENCNICIKACPTKSLCEPFMMNRSTCISCLTTWEGWDLTKDENSSKMGKWIYGCDICQDVCPMNKGKWKGNDEFPNLSFLNEIISPEKLIEMSYEDLIKYIQPKFWYIEKDDIWKWKMNALNSILNSKNRYYMKYIEIACKDENINVRKMAEWVKERMNERESFI